MSDVSQHRGRIVLDAELFARLASERGWETDTKAAEALGIPQPTLSRLKAGKCQPSAAVMYDLPWLLDVPTRLLFKREEL